MDTGTGPVLRHSRHVPQHTTPDSGRAPGPPAGPGCFFSHRSSVFPSFGDSFGAPHPGTYCRVYSHIHSHLDAAAGWGILLGTYCGTGGSCSAVLLGTYCGTGGSCSAVYVGGGRPALARWGGDVGVVQLPIGGGGWSDWRRGRERWETNVVEITGHSQGNAFCRGLGRVRAGIDPGPALPQHRIAINHHPERSSHQDRVAVTSLATRTDLQGGGPSVSRLKA